MNSACRLSRLKLTETRTHLTQFLFDLIINPPIVFVLDRLFDNYRFVYPFSGFVLLIHLYDSYFEKLDLKVHLEPSGEIVFVINIISIHIHVYKHICVKTALSEKVTISLLAQGIT